MKFVVAMRAARAVTHDKTIVFSLCLQQKASAGKKNRKTTHPELIQQVSLSFEKILAALVAAL